MKICIWGDELIGWVSGTMLAQYGNQISFIRGDNQESASMPVFSEPGLRKLIEEQEKSGRITFCNIKIKQEDTQDNIQQIEVHLFCFSANQKPQALEAA